MKSAECKLQNGEAAEAPVLTVLPDPPEQARRAHISLGTRLRYLKGRAYVTALWRVNQEQNQAEIEWARCEQRVLRALANMNRKGK